MLQLEAPLPGPPRSSLRFNPASCSSPSILPAFPVAIRAPAVGDPFPHATPSLGNSHKQLIGTPWRVFLLDAKPLFYDGGRTSWSSFARWISLLFARVTLRDPVIAIMDGEGGNEYRRRILPSYKSHRRPYVKSSCSTSMDFRAAEVLRKCNVPVVEVPGYEADDVVAKLTDEVLQMGFRVVIGSPDKDLKQLISKDVQMVMPIPELGRWSFYTLDHYIAQYKCNPSSDLSFRCFLGDEADGVPGIQHLVPGFGRRTTLKLIRKHGTFENLLSAASIRAVGKAYVHEALTKHADHLRRNYDVLSLRRDANIDIKEEWLSERETSNDAAVLKMVGVSSLPAVK